jgi:hypothetical protein
MAFVNVGQQHGGYGPKVGQSREGYPIFLYTDPETKLASYVVVLPDGRAFSSDSGGRLLTTYGNKANFEAATAILLGTGGLLLGGPIGGIVGALAGAIVGSQLKKMPRSPRDAAEG